MANILSFSEDIATMTYPQGIAFIERSRRQLARFEQLAAPEASNQHAELSAIRRAIDDLENLVRSHPDCPPELAFP